VVRAGRVAGGRADAFVLFLDELVVGQVLVRGVAPVFLAHPRMQQLGEGFGQAVGASLQVTGQVVPLACVGIGDRFVPHGDPAVLRSRFGLDAGGIVKTALDLVARGRAAERSA